MQLIFRADSSSSTTDLMFIYNAEGFIHCRYGQILKYLIFIKLIVFIEEIFSTENPYLDDSIKLLEFIFLKSILKA